MSRPRVQGRLHRSMRLLLLVIAVGLTMTAATRILRRAGVLPTEALPASGLHVALLLGVVLMLGNIIVTEAWLYMAERAGERFVIRFAVQAVSWADVFFTAPGIYLVVISGLLLIEQGDLSGGWLVGAEISFLLAGVTWLFLLVPMQNRLAVRAATGNVDAGFFTILHRWYLLGLLATALTIVALVLTVLQP